jgi:tetratricopeptide (TPR) repeat protein
LLEQFKYKDGADAFKRALQIDPKLALAKINLAIALYNEPDFPASQREAQAATALAPNAPQPHYILGLIAKSQARMDEAIGPFQQVLKLDPNDVGANVNLGQIYSQQRKYPKQLPSFERHWLLNHTTQLHCTTWARLNSRRTTRRRSESYSALPGVSTRGSGSSLGNNYLEQGRYADAVASTGAEPELVDRTPP